MKSSDAAGEYGRREMKIQLSDHFNYKKLLRFTLPSIVMMIFTSIYGVVDGFFISNFAGKTEFAAVNFIMPVIMIVGGLGFMIGTGGSAIVARTLGEGRREKANEYFSMMIYVTVVLGLVVAVLGEILLRPVTYALGAEGDMAEYCILYGRISFLSIMQFMLQNVFQSFFVTAQKPQLGLAVIIAAGVTNMVLDYLFVGVFQWSVAGAAAATAISETIGAAIPLTYFAFKNSSLLRLTKCRIQGKILLKACTNGSSELMTNISTSLVNMLYNLQLMRIAGENGVAAYGVIMYVNFIFIAVFIGYSIGSAPIVGYHYGAGHHDELKNLLRRSLRIVGLFGISMLILAETCAGPLTQFFVGYDAELQAMTNHGFLLYCLAFLVNGFNISGSAFFTALNNGAVSAAISFLRTLLFQIAALFLLPLFLGLNGIWLSIFTAEILALCVTITFFIKMRDKYHYA